MFSSGRREYNATPVCLAVLSFLRQTPNVRLFASNRIFHNSFLLCIFSVYPLHIQ